MNEILNRGWDDLVGRFDGPMSFRIFIQPAVAIGFAIRAGLRDARERRPIFFWTALLDPNQRRGLIHEAWKDVGKLFVVASVVDLIYQVVEFHWFHPVQALIVAITLAFVPYLILRGLTNRIAARIGAEQPTTGQTSARMQTKHDGRGAPPTNKSNSSDRP